MRTDGTAVRYLLDGRSVGVQVNGVRTQGLLYQGALTPVAELDDTGAVISQFSYAERATVPNVVRTGGNTLPYHQRCARQRAPGGGRQQRHHRAADRL